MGDDPGTGRVPNRWFSDLVEPERRLYRKYDVRRTDGRSIEGQEFFVLRIDPASEDEAAFVALKAYADALDYRDPLAVELDKRYHEWKRD